MLLLLEKKTQFFVQRNKKSEQIFLLKFDVIAKFAFEISSAAKTSTYRITEKLIDLKLRRII